MSSCIQFQKSLISFSKVYTKNVCFNHLQWFQDRKGARMRLYGRNHRPPSAMNKPKQTLNCGQVVFHLNHDFEDHESKNMGKYDRIYPANDRQMQDLYNVFLAGAESIFKHSFDMKVKETIAKVREDRKQEQIAREEEEKRKIEQQRRAQRVARNAALAALAAKDASKNATLSTNPTSSVSLDQIEGTIEGIIESPQRLKDDHRLGQWSLNDGKIVNEYQHLDQSLVSTHDINLDPSTHANDSFICTKEMTLQEKVDQWQQRGCFELPADDFVHEDFDKKKKFAKETLLEDRLHAITCETSRKMANKDGGVLLMLEQNEVRLLKQEAAAQQLEEDTQALLQKIIETEKNIIEDGKKSIFEDGKNQSKRFVNKSISSHIGGRLWKKINQSNIAIRGHQLLTNFQTRQQGKHVIIYLFNIF